MLEEEGNGAHKLHGGVGGQGKTRKMEKMKTWGKVVKEKMGGSERTFDGVHRPGRYVIATLPQLHHYVRNAWNARHVGISDNNASD